MLKLRYLEILIISIIIILVPRLMDCSSYKCDVDSSSSDSNSTTSCLCATSTSDTFKLSKESDFMCLIFHGLNDSFLYNVSDAGNLTAKNLFYFSVLVDQFSLIELYGSQLNSTKWKNHSYVQLEVGGYVSENRTIVFRNWTITQLTAVIYVNNGHVYKIDWDDNCYGCDSTYCIKDNCGIPTDTCNEGTNCDFSLYVSWYGTDKNGNYFTSSGQRLSRYQSGSARGFYDDVKDSVTDIDWESSYPTYP